MSRFEPLTQFLQNQPGSAVRLSFAQIEQIVGFKLPAVAQQERAWWSNSREGEDKAWLAAGFLSEEVDLAAGELTFRRDTLVDHVEFVMPSSVGRHPIFGWAKGMITIAPGVDLTEPADPDLAEWIDKKYGPSP
jgi:hypothetical protein